MPAYSSVTTLKGGLEVNYAMALAGTNDPGGKIAILISAINILNSSMSLIQAALTSANASGVTFSALSGVTFTSTYTSITNFVTS